MKHISDGVDYLLCLLNLKDTMKKEIKSSISLPENIDDSKATRIKKPPEVETVEKDEIEKSSNKENLRGWRIYKRKSLHFTKAVLEHHLQADL